METSTLDECLARELQSWDEQGLRRVLRPVDGAAVPGLALGGKSLIHFAGNDYLGLANHPEVIAAAIEATRRYGAGSTASRLIVGSLRCHLDLEEALAEFIGTPAALSFSSGYSAALGMIPAVVGTGDYIVLDRLTHACCVDAARLSGATLRVFPHNDTNRLSEILSSIRNKSAVSSAPRILVVTESVFSMDGDLAPLAEMVRLKEQHGAWLMVDEAHGTGWLGERRTGGIGAAGLEGRVDIHLGTLGKALGSAGGFIAGSRTLVEHALHRARSFMFSTAPVPAAAAAALAAIRIVRSDEGGIRAERLMDFSWRVRRQLDGLGMPTRGVGPILPILTGSTERALDANRRLEALGIWIPAIRYPTVARNASRLRLSVTAAHDEAQLEALFSALGRVFPLQ